MAPRVLRMDEPDGRWSVLELPDNRLQALVLAAGGLVASSPEGDGRARALEVLLGGGPDAVVLASKILVEALS